MGFSKPRSGAMRDINLWAYQSNDFTKLCDNASVDESTGLKYPAGGKSGQSGWDVAVPYTSLDELAKKLARGIAMPRQYCGNWLSDCSPVQRGEIGRLAIMAHGKLGGEFAVNGKNDSVMLNAGNVADFHTTLHSIGCYTRQDATILLVGCLAGQDLAGTSLLKALSGIWPGRLVVGFCTIGYRHPGEMKKVGDACEMPGMRDTDARSDLAANPPKWDKLWSNYDKLPWASETSINAKSVRNGVLVRAPANEYSEADIVKINKLQKETAALKAASKKPALHHHHKAP
jgi:hypothetical protein